MKIIRNCIFEKCFTWLFFQKFQHFSHFFNQLFKLLFSDHLTGHRTGHPKKNYKYSIHSTGKKKKRKKRIIDHRYLCSRYSKEILASILFNQEEFSEISKCSFFIFLNFRSIEIFYRSSLQINVLLLCLS